MRVVGYASTGGWVNGEGGGNALYRNDGAGIFAEVGLRANAALGETGLAQAGMGAAWGDYDNDGDGDLLVTNFEDDYNTLYRNTGRGTFADWPSGVLQRLIGLPIDGYVRVEEGVDGGVGVW